MIERFFWINQINKAWEKRSLVWLSGVRRSGKTTLCKMFKDSVFLNCDLPSVQRQLENPEFFLSNISTGSIVVFDEIHHLENPSQVLKIAVDEFPQLKILATGSSTLAATKKFRDSLTGRKIQLFFPPVLWTESMNEFRNFDIDNRLLMGGLPEFLLSKQKTGEFYSEWIDSYYARDISELFSVRNRTGFLKLLNLLFLQSGGKYDITSLSKDCGLSRPTVMSHLEALTIAHAVYLVSPFFGKGSREILKQPKLYAFDTGFVSYVNGWNEISENVRGILWEHLVLDMLRVKFQNVFYWCDGYEIDFIVKGEGNEVHTYECKINPKKFENKALKKFRELYPEGRNYCIVPHIISPYRLLFGNSEVEFISFV